MKRYKQSQEKENRAIEKSRDRKHKQHIVLDTLDVIQAVVDEAAKIQKIYSNETANTIEQKVNENLPEGFYVGHVEVYDRTNEFITDPDMFDPWSDDADEYLALAIILGIDFTGVGEIFEISIRTDFNDKAKITGWDLDIVRKAGLGEVNWRTPYKAFRLNKDSITKPKKVNITTKLFSLGFKEGAAFLREIFSVGELSALSIYEIIAILFENGFEEEAAALKSLEE